ncbi:MAG: TAXI family TRAP transporter solute-binding subunit [Sphaerochaeta sp.]|uniref:TAXI family TRAP transporter solute-binding subunit n=1 Tax=Sphaerochaeta sp. TaxID=1972642 RepID=UPI001DECD26C|nr:TAXI family TRAP transporter solute-binding subunit [uncultured Sphaerochaeta sp.]MDD3057483.1 TAXI family TRAP transporter solute-binding subunit [Sphaerochaeta sp.]MDD3928833.1 TAXI family TRAP transporter solute-binding subunit [Sphaerochaeta sp.]NCC12183.1 TAXI family TRAP transporter solute-binding subunit [Spirochaetia bacterium]NCC89320.1 TAXI family TRAP transporter solute-binding subunit [Spirochaetia bacterium]
MKKTVVLALLVALLTGSLLFGAGAQETQGAQAPVKKTVINFPTAATTGAVYPLGSAMSNLWNTKLDNVRASAQASAGGIANLNMIADGEAQLGVAVTSIMYESFNGIGSFEGRPNPNLRVMIGLYANPNQVVVTNNSGINSLTDLAGKRFASGAPGSTTEVETSIHLKTSGVSYPEGLRVQYVGFTEAIDLMRNKQLDGAWIMAGTPNAAVTEMLSTAGGKLLSLDENLIKALQKDYPWYGAYTIPAGTYPGQDADVLTSAIKITICTDARVDDDVIYAMTKTFWENFEELKATQAPLKNVNPKEAVKDLAGLPIHEGAARYYREIGLL